MYTPGTKCVITWLPNISCWIKVGEVVVVGHKIILPMRDRPEWARRFRLSTSRMRMEHQQIDADNYHTYQPTEWMLPLEDPDTIEDLIEDIVELTK